jgi:general secretion pathway protein K
MRRWGNNRGTALVTALLITAVMASVSISLSQSLFFSIERSSQIGYRDTAYWYALGARDFAESVLLRSLPRDGEPMRPRDAWNQGARQFEIDNGALIGEVRDAQNCFNLNSLVQREERGYIQAPEASERFVALLQAMNIPSIDARTISAQATDWIDSDNRPVARGAEDSVYAARPVPHRAANSLFVEREELRALPAVHRGLYASIAPFVCALPDTAAQPLNLNTLRPEQAALLAAELENRISLSDAALILSRRPTTGYESVAEFWADPLLTELEWPEDERPEFGLTSRFFEIHVDVLQGDNLYRLTETVEIASGRRLVRHGQRFGVLS